ncbi:MAG: LicD family protein [Prevotella sp.]|nr:LicD family protein [Prevotella sp.]
MMKEMTLQEVQQVSLEILKDVHRFCEANGINYTLFGGTMIGAIRHKGFIPWDDDVDIAMPRPDYERFLKMYQSEKGYKLFASGSKENFLAFSRVCEMEKTSAVNVKMPWANQPTGVWIDIFPLDGAPDDEKECELLLEKLRWHWRKSCYARTAKSPLSARKGGADKLKTCVKKLVYNDWFITPQRVISHYNQTASKIPWRATGHFWNCSYLRYGMKEYQEMSDYTSTVLVPFEDAMFRVCNGYDHFMRTKYGDYMQLPPEDKRKSNHALCSYYWREQGKEQQ